MSLKSGAGVLVGLILVATFARSMGSDASCGNNHNTSDAQFAETQSGVLSRKRRYVAFPEGSSFSVAVCSTIGVIGNPNNALYSFGLNWGVAYDLPNSTWILSHLNGFPNKPVEDKFAEKRRSRREFYQEIENGLDNMGYNGRDCILRTLCESFKFFSNKENDMFLEIIRIIFSFPGLNISPEEHSQNFEYIKAFRRGRYRKNCESFYTKCSFSLLEIIFGEFFKRVLGIK